MAWRVLALVLFRDCATQCARDAETSLGSADRDLSLHLLFAIGADGNRSFASPSSALLTPWCSAVKDLFVDALRAACPEDAVYAERQAARLCFSTSTGDWCGSQIVDFGAFFAQASGLGSGQPYGTLCEAECRDNLLGYHLDL